MISGSYTAIITPFEGAAVDYEGLGQLVDFQVENGITGVLAVGTTGESPTLTWEEHNKVVELVAARTRDRVLCIAGTGSNNTAETIAATTHAVDVGVSGVLLVDPYYNGPSSLEIRKEYVEPVATAFPDLDIIPYVIPGRTGAQLLPEDLAILSQNHRNVGTVKEATGNFENMRRTRECCGADFSIMSGDDSVTVQMMTDPKINAAGVISVISNVVPRAIADMVRLLEKGDEKQARAVVSQIEPLFDLVTVTTTESTPFGDTPCRARNPLAIKTLIAILGMPAGGCRKPMGKMTRKGLDVVLETARTVHAGSPAVFAPLADFFGVNIDARLDTPSCWEGLSYEDD
ncbi:MAG: 4-hydroxy-tetrahydrodipicolinate synthase [Desulfobacterales bacterium]